MATETVLNKLTINSVESREVYQKMQEKGLINEDEIYLVTDDGSDPQQGGMPAQIIVTAPTGSTVTATLETKEYSVTENNGRWTFDVTDYGTYTIKATKDEQTATDTVVVSVVQQYTVALHYFTATIHVSVDSGSTVTCTKGNETQSKTADETGTVDFTVAESGTYTITATKDGQTAEGTAIITEDGQAVNVKLAYIHIYGVQWDGSSTTALSRTDASANFTDPVPAVSNGNGSSPFDNLQPWAGMTKVTDSVGGVLVKIPKFYYKWTKSGNTLKLQIADGATDGFYVSPAHADRGDGKGERDIVYVGRYHCASEYKSTTGVAQQVNITRSTARTQIQNLGTGFYQFDYAMRLTIQMLYLVEFANWNSQAKIGYGCSSSGSKANNGQTDAMTYHTGTTAANRTTYGFTQYRYIEGLWDNVYDWMDGCYNSSKGLNIILNPTTFSDSTGGTSIGTPPGGWISAFNVVESGGVQWLCPSGNSGSDSTYIPDNWVFYSSHPCLCCGGYYYQSLYHGLFYVSYGSTSDTYSSIGCRLQKLP